MAPSDANKPGSYESPNKKSSGQRSEYDHATDEKHKNNKSFNRRSFLKLTGIATAGVAASGLASRASAVSQEIQFDTVLNAVDDLGMDPNGNESIDATLEDAYNDRTLIEFPPGEYLISESHVNRSVSRFGIRGLGDNRRDVQFVAQKGYAGKWLNAKGVGPHLIENVSFHERDDDYSGVSFVLKTTGGTVIRNVEWLGRTPVDNKSDAGYQITVDVTNTDGVSVVENVAAGLHAPAAQAEYPNGLTFFRNSPSHKGEVILRNVVAHQRAGSGMRSTNMSGVVTVEDCEFVNCSNSNLRFGAGNHPSQVSSADGVRIVVNDDILGSLPADAVRVDSSDQGYSGAIFKNLTVEWSVNNGRGVIASSDFMDHGRAEFYNCVIRNDSQRPTVNAQEPGMNISDRAFVFENCAFTGSGGDFVAEDRPGSVIRDSCINLPNASVRGFDTQNVSSSNCRQPSDSDSSGTNSLPSPAITVTGKNGLTVDLSGADSSDSDGEIAAYEWDIDGTSDSGQTVSHTFDSAGTYSVSLTVKDDAGASATTTDEVIIGYPNTLKIQGRGTPAQYSFEVTETLQPKKDTVEKYDDVSDTGATGWVTQPEHIDEFAFDGDLSLEFLEGEADVYIDGEQVDPASLNNDDETPTEQSLEVVGTGVVTNYEVTVSGDLEGTDDSIEPWDVIDGSTATGYVTDTSDRDAFVFTGEVADITFHEGEADVYIDGEQVDPSNI
jgi:PKD repeat protein